MRPRTNWLGVLAILAAATCVVAGCWPRIVTPKLPEIPANPVAAASPFFPHFRGLSTTELAAFSALDWAASICIGLALLNVILLAASAWVPFIGGARKGLFLSLFTLVGAALASWFLKAVLVRFMLYFVYTFGGIVLVLAVVVGYPYVKTIISAWLERSGWKLKKTGHNSGGTALIAKARGLTKNTKKHIEARAEILKRTV